MAAEIPQTMKALIHNFKTGALYLETTAPVPRPSANEYLIEVHATALCRGELSWPRPEEYNESRPGVEAAGIIVVGPEGGRFAKGKRVYFRTSYPRAGSAGDYSLALESELAVAPTDLSFTEAAAVPVSALSAWQVISKHLGPERSLFEAIREGKALHKKLFINGASSAVGLWLTQLGVAAGYDVIGTSSHEHLLLSLGAKKVINYKTMSITTWLASTDERYDLVIDLVDNLVDCAGTAETWHAAKSGGLVLTLVPPADMNWIFDLDTPADIDPSIKGHFFLMQPVGSDLAQISRLFEEKKIKSFVDSVYPLEQYESAFQRLDSKRAVGKVVIEVRK